MKSILILSLLFVCVFSAEEAKPVELESASDIIAIVKCFLGKDELIADVDDIIEIVKSGDYSKLLTVAFKVYADVTAAIKECVPQTSELQGIFNFGKNRKYRQCLRKCEAAEDAETCKKECKNKYYPVVPCKEKCGPLSQLFKKCKKCKKEQTPESN